MDEARIGQKGRNGHRWWPKSERAPGLADKRFVSTYLYAAVRPTTDDAFALVLPEVNANTMDIIPRSLRRVPRAEHPRHRAARSSRMARREGARGAGGRSHPQHQKRTCSSSS